MITVSIVEDHGPTRDSLVALLKKAEGIICVSDHANGETAVRELQKHRPRIVLMDLNLPGMSGVECVSRIKRDLPETDVLMLTAYDDPEPIIDSLRAGASGYLLKSMSLDEITEALQQVVNGGGPMSPSVARKVIDFVVHQPQPKAPQEISTLTPREREILGLLAKGLHYKEIADRSGMSVGNVRNRVHSIYQKLNVQSRTEAVLKFLGQ
jgi:DNA-binding NarL/FixJ family response regulator